MNGSRSPAGVIIAGDDNEMTRLVVELLRDVGGSEDIASVHRSVDGAIEMMRESGGKVVVLVLPLDGTDPVGTVARVTSLCPGNPVIAVMARGEGALAVDLVGQGAHECIAPADLDGATLARAIVLAEARHARATRRERAGEELASRESFIRTVLDNLPIGVAVNSVAPAVAFKYMNDAFPRVYHTTREALANPDAFWTAVYGETGHMERVRRMVLEDCATGDLARMRWDDILVGQPGEPGAYISAANIPVPSLDVMISVAWDVTARKLAEDRLIQLNEELEQRVEERTRSLREMQERLIRQEKLATIGKLAGSVSHELRNPLGVITNSIFYLQQKVSCTDEKIARHFQIIHEQALRATEIIKDLLTLTMVQHGDVSDVDFPSLVDRVLHEHVKVPASITIRRAFPPGLPPARADPRRVAQALSNIITNAFQAMRGGGGTLTVRAWHDGGMIAVAITDTGPGIPSEVLPKVFDPLFSTKSRGIGLGLTIARDIVDAFGGRIDVASSEGEGTTVTVHLPAAT